MSTISNWHFLDLEKFRITHAQFGLSLIQTYGTIFERNFSTFNVFP